MGFLNRNRKVKKKSKKARFQKLGITMLEGAKSIGGLQNQSSKTKKTGLFQRMTAAFPPLFFFISKVSFTSLPNLSLFWHINVGIEEIIADHVHQEMTRNFLLVYLRLFLLIVIKDVFLSLVSFPNKSKNLMDRTNPWLLRNISALRCGRNVLF
uniref:Succinate dehydrogenase subunit 4 n=1 Tax=Schisandra sphenanthera TaxID=13674 RepID=A0A4D6QDI0_SCHSP|nr:succinate dehydrogenase subunit 4 [Schisandra sphenanthera]QCF45723.1 succinate dehydrogenase subunit 4 [Schisandra sphenanthera]